MYKDGLVSVIIPAYNCSKYLVKAVESAVNQTYKNIEVIIVDDCSTDDTSSIIEYICRKYNNVFSYRNEKNSGVAFTRNNAVDKASGQYIAYLDADDVWDKTKIEKQLEVFKDKINTPLVFSAIDFIDENDVSIKSKRKIKKIVSFRYLLRHTPISTSSVVIDRKVVSNIKMPLRKTAEDYSLWLQVLKKYGNAVGIDEVLVHYRKTSTSLSSKKSKEIKHFYDVQVKDLKIKKICAAYNTICYVLYAIKKHFF